MPRTCPRLRLALALLMLALALAQGAVSLVAQAAGSVMGPDEAQRAARERGPPAQLREGANAWAGGTHAASLAAFRDSSQRPAVEGERMQAKEARLCVVSLSILPGSRQHSSPGESLPHCTLLASLASSYLQHGSSPGFSCETSTSVTAEGLVR